MSNITAKNPVTEFNKFLWNILLTEVPSIMPIASYQGLIPIIPTQQQPEFQNNNADSPYFVYSYRTSFDDDAHWLVNTEVVYTLYDDNVANDNKILKAIQLYLNDIDESAKLVNEYLKGIGSEEFWYQIVRVDSVNSPDPSEQEGGRYGLIICIQLVTVNAD